jgi:hypothetical protein
MRHIISVILLLSSLYSYSQLYISSGTIFTLNGLETQISSKESINIINTHIKGTGVFNLLGSSEQYLESSKGSLEMPNLFIKDASLLYINTALSINNELIIENGILVLSHDLMLNSPYALILKGQSEVIETSKGKLVFMEFFTQRSVINAIVSVFYISPKNPYNSLSFTIEKVILAKVLLKYIDYYNVTIKTITPPPKLV